MKKLFRKLRRGDRNVARSTTETYASMGGIGEGSSDAPAAIEHPKELHSQTSCPAFTQGSATLKEEPNVGETQPSWATEDEGASYPFVGSSTAQTLPYGIVGVSPELQDLVESVSTCRTSLEIKELIRARVSPLCSVCRNLDASRAPPDRDNLGPWARREYKLPAGISIAKITIDDSAKLRASARGCFYCHAVLKVFDAVVPGWGTERSYITLFLATDLPVVARLVFGAIFSSSKEPDLVLPGKRPVKHTAEINYSPMPSVDSDLWTPPPESRAWHPFAGSNIDIEIYRRDSLEQFSISDLALSPLVNYVGNAQEISRHAGDPKCFEFIRQHVSDCIRTHICGNNQESILPDRVIWIRADNDSGIKLLEPQGTCAEYIALSYCWGDVGPDTYLTDSTSFEARKLSIQLNDLPLLFQDVIECARRFDIEYIWIDRLCIIQGDEEDFKQQAPKMGEVYGNATFVIAAASGTSENDAILRERNNMSVAGDIAIQLERLGSLNLRFRRRTPLLGTEDKGGDYKKVSTRAWVWQERLLARRTVFYTPSGLKFECRCSSVWEGNEGLIGHSWSSQLDIVTPLTWLTLVEEYTRRDITRPSDRLPAITSVMKRIEESHRWSSIYGMWINNLVQSLGWQSGNPLFPGEHSCRMNPSWYAPTWSWASVDGPISYGPCKPLGGIPGGAPIVYMLELVSVDAAAGLIIVAGNSAFVELTCEIGPNHPSSTEPLNRWYELMNVSSSGGPFHIDPDVALKPYSSEFEGSNLSSLARVPYGEKAPEKSWSGKCLCLLLGVRTGTRRTLVLLLSPSLRVPGAWERIGVASGIAAGVFSASQSQIIKIV